MDCFDNYKSIRKLVTSKFSQNFLCVSIGLIPLNSYAYDEMDVLKPVLEEIQEVESKEQQSIKHDMSDVKQLHSKVDVLRDDHSVQQKKIPVPFFQTLHRQEPSHIRISDVYLDTPNIRYMREQKSIDQLDFYEAVDVVLQRNPSISELLASVFAQNENVEIARSKYFPQISGGVKTGDLDSKDRGQQTLSLTASQMVYDFGKTKASVDVERAYLKVEQAKVLGNVDEISHQVIVSIINVIRYQKLIQIAEQQIDGLKRIHEITALRAKAGISSQADPIQAQAFIQSAESSLIAQQTYLKQYQVRINNLLGLNANHVQWEIPEEFVKKSGIFDDFSFNEMSKILIAQAELQAARAQKKNVALSRYPTIELKGSLSQALNKSDNYVGKSNGFDSAIMLEATSKIYQGGAITAQNRSANYAEQMAQAKIESAILDVETELNTSQADISNKQRQMEILLARQQTAIRTRELYQEQYKLGTRSAVDLLNAETSIHTAKNDLENTRYDVYQLLANFVKVSGRSIFVYKLNNKNIQGFSVNYD